MTSTTVRGSLFTFTSWSSSTFFSRIYCWCYSLFCKSRSSFRSEKFTCFFSRWVHCSRLLITAMLSPFDLPHQPPHRIERKLSCWRKKSMDPYVMHLVSLFFNSKFPRLSGKWDCEKKCRASLQLLCGVDANICKEASVKLTQSLVSSQYCQVERRDRGFKLLEVSCLKKSFFVLNMSIQLKKRRQIHEQPSLTLLISCTTVSWVFLSVRTTRFVIRVVVVVYYQPTVAFSRKESEDPSSLLGIFQMLRKVHGMSTVPWSQDPPKTLSWSYCILVPTVLRHGLSEILKRLKSDIFHSSSKERTIRPISSLWERSFPPSSSDMERTYSLSPLYSFTEKHFELQPQILPHAVDKLLAGLNTLFSKNSTTKEFKVRPDPITVVSLIHLDKMHTHIYEILQDCEELKMRLISICFTCFYLLASWIACMSRRVFKTHFYLCTLNV